MLALLMSSKAGDIVFVVGAGGGGGSSSRWRERSVRYCCCSSPANRYGVMTAQFNGGIGGHDHLIYSGVYISFGVCLRSVLEVIAYSRASVHVEDVLGLRNGSA